MCLRNGMEERLQINFLEKIPNIIHKQNAIHSK